MVQGKYPLPILHKRILGLSKIKLLTHTQRVYNACPNFYLPHTPINHKPLHPQTNKTYCMFFTDIVDSFFRCFISHWIYENMALLVSVYRSDPYRSFAKSVLGIKTLTWPSPPRTMGDCPPTELCNYHDNHSQQRPDSAGKGKLRKR